MDLQCRCTHCSATFKVDSAAAGKKARCPKCSTVVDVPLSAAPAPAKGSPTTIKSRLTAPSDDASAWPPGMQPPGMRPSGKQPASAVESASSIFSSDELPTEIDLAGAARSKPTFGLAETSTKKSPLPRAVVATSTPAAENPAKGSTKKSSPLPLILAGGGGVLALVIAAVVGGLMVMGTGTPEKSGKQKSAGGSATLVLDWPEAERKNSALDIDGKRVSVPPSGEARITVAAGKRKLFIQRRGFEPVEKTLTFLGGQTQHFAPRWNAVAASGVKPSTPTQENNSSSTSFPIGGGAAPDAAFSPQGFPGWYQLLDAAQRQAARNKKELLIVFGSSDADQETQKLASRLSESATKSAVDALFVPVVIDFPQTRQGFNRIEDRAQNVNLLQQYAIRELPTLVLADEKGRPYFVQREWTGGMDNLAGKFNDWKNERAARDQLLEATHTADEASRLAAAEKSLAWIKERKLFSLFETEVREWLTLAQRQDSENRAGKLEAFVEAELQIRLREADQDDEQAIKAAIAPLSQWTGSRRFTDPDRGASLHLLAAALLMGLEQHDEGIKHLEAASSYEPKDKELQDALAAAKVALKNRDVLSTGTGFVISAAGYLFTNHHVVDGKGKVVVRVPGVADPVPAQVVAQDDERDMALIKIDVPAGVALTPIPLSTAEAGRGFSVTAFGYPLGDAVGSGLKLTTGVISAVPEASGDNMYLLDIRVNPGNSGGPLCDNKANVIGMVTAKTFTGSSESIDSYGMAIPAVDLIKFLEKHLPKDAPRAAAAGDMPLALDQVDRRVSPAVMMILKMK